MVMSQPLIHAISVNQNQTWNPSATILQLITAPLLSKSKYNIHETKTEAI